MGSTTERFALQNLVFSLSNPTEVTAHTLFSVMDNEKTMKQLRYELSVANDKRALETLLSRILFEYMEKSDNDFKQEELQQINNLNCICSMGIDQFVQ